ncbi:hypothetical protein AR457_39255 [Streptomyces agglomeratus]|uniref:N-acetyltransferase domain-containing protein n=1 Tax=Streptomyces agglomeratus TaxID=285458 RepID=A0A1E5NXD5_9ACTN|nr:GNAT family N-acetyltransferase [Streptomyces agglomeratus]OEJ20786.1 hypothetical protein AS594_40295 [Streptomyces agglomeratus]OEJ21964.1 hypothetical protein AR457_39255 [Streptomyces agglomeratus]OEJ28943.1 hypothetical protein AS594_35500 [Streptomyces agglomeratus]
MTDQAQEAWADALAEEIQTRYPGVRLQLGIDRGPYLVLFWIFLPESERGKGLGTRVMKHITAAADVRGVPITLSPSDTFGGDLHRLHAFYRRLGFVPNTRRGEIGSPRESMVRTPHSSASVG